jgi:hypothetical protein
LFLTRRNRSAVIDQSVTVIIEAVANFGRACRSNRSKSNTLVITGVEQIQVGARRCIAGRVCRLIAWQTPRNARDRIAVIHHDNDIVEPDPRITAQFCPVERTFCSGGNQDNAVIAARLLIRLAATFRFGFCATGNLNQTILCR